MRSAHHPLIADDGQIDKEGAHGKRVRLRFESDCIGASGWQDARDTPSVATFALSPSGRRLHGGGCALQQGSVVHHDQYPLFITSI
jgi:hypothetical protein